MGARLAIAAAFGALTAACGGAPPQSAAPAPRLTAIRYDVALRSADPWVLDVRATFEGGAARGALAFPPAVRGVTVEEAGREREPEPHGRAWQIGCASTCAVRYTVDLSAAAELTGDSASVAVRSGGDVLAPGSVWMMRPEPADHRVKAQLYVDARDPAAPQGEPYRFAAPFPRDAATGAYQLIARDIGALGYTTWGRFSSFTVQATSGVVDVIALRGARAADDAALTRWVSVTARAMDTVYGRFPIDHVLIAVVPSPGSSEVDFGRTVPAGGASIVLFTGERADEAALRADWVLAHEMFHLGVPSMPRDGRWLDEGLATYYEPILRARAGLLSDRAPWVEFRKLMPKGVATAAEPSLAVAEDHDRVYYGGSSFALTADVEIRRRTEQRRSLDDGLMRVLAEGGKATEVWSIDAFIAALDRGAEVSVVRALFERTLPRAEPCAPRSGAGPSLDLSRCAPDDSAALARLFQALGVSAVAEAPFDDAAPLAAVRRRIAGLDSAAASAASSGAAAESPGAGGTRAAAGVH